MSSDSSQSQSSQEEGSMSPRAHISPSSSISSEEPDELRMYQRLLSPDTREGTDTHLVATNEELTLAPLIWWDVKQYLARRSNPETALQQYGVLGHLPQDFKDGPKPVLLNTNSPWSAFLCGSQGSGKSHALSCMLESCLLDDANIGKNPKPLAGLVFHYDRTQSSDVCEAAYLCSKIPTRVLVSPSNYGKMKKRYEDMAKEQHGKIEVEMLRLLPNSHLDTERMKTLMAVGKDGEMPLYMHCLIKLLRDLAIKRNGEGNFDYQEFTQEIYNQVFTDRQNAPLMMRMELLESFLDLPPIKPAYSDPYCFKPPRNDSPKQAPIRDWSAYKPSPDYLVGKPGTLTIVDVTDPVVDSDTACVLFDTCLSIFIKQTECSKIVALDEAHNYMAEGSSRAVRDFTEKLLKSIREQRHIATRIVIATQEPTINTQLLDLCSITMVHRCTSPAWFAVLKKHIAALYTHGINIQEPDKDNPNDKALFETIVKLKLGESLLFCPTAAVSVDMKGGKIVRMDTGFKKFKTRARVTADGGQTRTSL